MEDARPGPPNSNGNPPLPLTIMQVPIHRRGERDLALHELVADGKLEKTPFELHRTFDGRLWFYLGTEGVDQECYVISLRDIIIGAADAVTKAAAEKGNDNASLGS